MNYDEKIYELILEENIDELRAKGYLLRHIRSGARVVLIENDDDNKVFSIGFRTPPPDSSGVPHILEHSVLCGSDKYPVKDPFMELAKGSLNTFLNAMTYPDKTVYPVASYNDKDFKNLMDVYMDAVLHPLIASRKEVFLQEGWHYELDSVDGELTYNGVVYNEMKGAFSSPDDVLNRYCLNSLYPDTSYATESGGDPHDIPKLSYESFVNFYRKLYHPANSYIYLYGDCDMTERLEYLDREYLSSYERIEVDSELKTQAPFDKEHRVETTYSVTKEEGTTNKTYLALNYSISTSLDKETCYGFQMLDYALFSAPGAPVKQALIDAGIGDDVYSMLECGIKQPMLSIVAKNANPEQEADFKRIICETLKKLVAEGVNRETLTAAINSAEFRYREADFGRFPKGLMYGLSLMETWLYDEKRPFDRIALNEIFQFLKDSLHTDFYEQLIEKYLLQNTHTSFVLLRPEVDLTAKEDEALAKELESYKATLTKEECEAIVKQTQELKRYQSEPSSAEDLEKIPLLNREDIRKEVEPLCNQVKEIAGVKVVHHDYYTNGIGYMKLCFGLDAVADEELVYVGLLSILLGFISTKKHTYDELSNEIDIHTGGIYPDLMQYRELDHPERFHFYLGFSAKALIPTYDKVFALIEEMMTESDYRDYKRLKEVLYEIKSRLQTKLVSSGHSTAIGICTAHMTEGGRFTSLTAGLESYEFVCDLIAHFDERKEALAEKLETLVKKIFVKNRMVVSVTADVKEVEAIESLLQTFLDRLPDCEYKAETRSFTYGPVQLGYKTAGQVNYVARAGDFSKAGLRYDGALVVLKNIMATEYLWNQVRVMGGAYGCMNGYGSYGISYFVSYRDPHCKETNAVYEKAPEFIRNLDLSEREMTKYIIGAFSEMDTPLTPRAKGERSFDMYMGHVSEAYLQEKRDRVRTVTLPEIRELATYVETILSDNYLVAVGNGEVLTKDAELFTELRSIS